MTKKTRPDAALDFNLRAEFVARIADDDEPIRVMLAMLRAANEFAIDLALDESVDASEGLTPNEIADIITHSGKAVTILEKMYRRIK